MGAKDSRCLMKMTNISMVWTDTGAVIKTTVELDCPRCGVNVEPGIEHRCGDQLLPDAKPNSARSKRVPIPHRAG